MVCCFPIKLEKADAAWSRVVAILDDEEQGCPPHSTGTAVGEAWRETQTKGDKL
jgi:hypothetical protein